MLAKLLEKKMKYENLSLRKAAAVIGISHETVSKVLAGNLMDLETLKKMCDWLGISPFDILASDYGISTPGCSKASIHSDLDLLINSNPSLALEMENAYYLQHAGVLETEDIEQILSFIAYRIYLRSILRKNATLGDKFDGNQR